MQTIKKTKTSKVIFGPTLTSLWKGLKFHVSSFKLRADRRLHPFTLCIEVAPRAAHNLKPGTWNFKPLKGIPTFRSGLILWILILGLISCRAAYNTSVIEVELMKPSKFTIPEGYDNIAIFNRSFIQSDTTTFTYTFDSKNNWSKNKLLYDRSIHYPDLSNKCIDSLISNLENEKYFLKVINYRDSMNYLFNGTDRTDSQNNSPELHKKLGADVFIFLDYFHFDDHQPQNTNSDFIYHIQDGYPEFNKSKKFEIVNAKLIWSMFIKGDSIRHIIEQPDDLYYGNTVNPEFFGNSDNHKLLLENASIFLGKSFVSKILPSLKNEERIYYQSNRIHMRKAEKFLLNGDWLKAAEIYNKQTKNKNHNIAAQARFNMALVSEMEGNLDAATDWLDHSKSAYKHGEPIYNCKEYNIKLEKRKKEIELLAKQIRKDAIN